MAFCKEKAVEKSKISRLDTYKNRAVKRSRASLSAKRV